MRANEFHRQVVQDSYRSDGGFRYDVTQELVLGTTADGDTHVDVRIGTDYTPPMEDGEPGELISAIEMRTTPNDLNPHSEIGLTQSDWDTYYQEDERERSVATHAGELVVPIPMPSDRPVTLGGQEVVPLSEEYLLLSIRPPEIE